MSRPIRTHDIELAASTMAVTGAQPTVTQEPGASLATFELSPDAITMDVLSKYATGELCLNIKRFTSCRNFLFKKLKEVR